MKFTNVSYCDAILLGFEYILAHQPKSFVIGQGLWSPWYVGNSMKGLEDKFGKARVIDTPVSELATTGVAIGAGLHGYNAIVVHPRMDFMILAADQIVNQAAKWRHMMGGSVSPNVTIRAIINRGGEQGAQHSQALHSWFAHIPGLRVLMPYSARDARDMLISAAFSSDPVLYIDDRWCYEFREDLSSPGNVLIEDIKPAVVQSGTHLTMAGAGYSVHLAMQAASELRQRFGVECEIFDVRQINPLDSTDIVASVTKTGRFLAIDGGWSNCGLAGELLARVSEAVAPHYMRASPKRVTLPPSPAPSSAYLEKQYYPTADDVVKCAEGLLGIYDE